MRVSKRPLLLLVVAVLCVICSGPAFAARDRPLSQHDLLALLAGGVYSSRIAGLVEERGISFVPTPEFLESLRAAGGQESLEHAVEVAPRIMPVAAPNRTKHRSTSRPSLAKAPALQPQIAPSQAARTTTAPVQTTPEVKIAAVPPGTTIDIRNWVNYRPFMPVGMAELFQGDSFWKMPRDIAITVGPTIITPLPKGYEEATEDYSGRVKIVHFPDGHSDLENYRGGAPFPNPSEPDKGYKLLADLWFAYIPHIAAGTSQNPLTTCSETSNRFISCVRFIYVFRQLAYNTDPGVPANETGVSGSWYSEWISIEQPEQLRYTTILTLYPIDNQRPKDIFIYLPGLRRWIRGSLAARCSPITGTDYAEDDYKRQGFNGGIGAFNAQFLRHQQILALTGNYVPLGGDFPRNYYMPLGWPKPSWGNWQVRDVDVIDVRPIPGEDTGYCYGKRILYEDSSTHYALWEDAYDTHMRLWKTALLAQRTTDGGGLGPVPGGFISSAWDLINGHMTNTSTENYNGVDVLVGDKVPAQYQNLISYSTPAGLAEISK